MPTDMKRKHNQRLPRCAEINSRRRHKPTGRKKGGTSGWNGSYGEQRARGEGSDKHEAEIIRNSECVSPYRLTTSLGRATTGKRREGEKQLQRENAAIIRQSDTLYNTRRTSTHHKERTPQSKVGKGAHRQATVEGGDERVSRVQHHQASQLGE